MRYNRDVAIRIFEILEDYLPAHFGKVQDDDYYDDDDDYIIGIDEIESRIWAIDNTVKFYSGVSKMVIVAESLGNVAIKVPFNGCYEYSDEYYDYQHSDEYDYADNEEEWDFERKYYFEKFCGGGGRYNNDYCAEEYAAYKELKELGYEKFVAETELLGGINGMYILIQEFVTPMNDFDKKIINSKKSIEASKRIREDYVSANKVDDDWVAACIEHYGEELSEKFFNYTEEDGYAILADAHWGNYGYREDGSPCVLDFSDYNG